MRTQKRSMPLMLDAISSAVLTGSAPPGKSGVMTSKVAVILPGATLPPLDKKMTLRVVSDASTQPHTIIKSKMQSQSS